MYCITPSKTSLRSLKRLIVGIRRRAVRRAAEVARVEHHQAFGVRHVRWRTQEYCVDNAKNCAVGPDAEGEGQRRSNCEGRCAHQSADRVANVLRDGEHGERAESQTNASWLPKFRRFRSSASVLVAERGPRNGLIRRRLVNRLPLHHARRKIVEQRVLTGTTNSVSSVDVISPPITARAIGARCSAPSPIASASGIMPKIIATVVMMIGRRRMRPTFSSALCRSTPLLALLVREVDQQNAVLRHEPHQHDDADHRHHVQRAAGDQQRRAPRR